MIINKEVEDNVNWYEVIANEMNSSNIYDDQGVVICYILAKSGMIKDWVIEVQIEKELGALEKNWFSYREKKFFKEFDSFIKFFREYGIGDLEDWDIEGIIDDIEVSIGGSGESDRFIISYDECGKDIDVEKIAEYVEKESYKYNEYTEEMIKEVQEENGYSYIEAVKCLNAITKEKDIYEEYKKMRKGKKPDKYIVISAISARLLMTKGIKLSKAYEILYYMKTNPEKGVEEIKNNTIKNKGKY